MCVSTSRGRTLTNLSSGCVWVLYLPLRTLGDGGGFGRDRYTSVRCRHVLIYVCDRVCTSVALHHTYPLCSSGTYLTQRSSGRSCAGTKTKTRCDRRALKLNKKVTTEIHIHICGMHVHKCACVHVPYALQRETQKTNTIEFIKSY